MNDLPITAIPATAPSESRRTDAVRLLAFLLAVMALFLAARQGQSQPKMYAAFAFFLVTATLWVRGLDSNWIAGREDYRRKLLLIAALVVPALFTAVIALTQEGTWSTVVLGMAIIVYTAMGLAVRKLRWYVIQNEAPEADASLERRFSWWLLSHIFRWQVLTVLFVAAYGALWLVGRVPLKWSGVLFAVLVAPIPALVHILSERRIIALSSADRDNARRWWFVASGAALGLGAVLSLISLTQTKYLVAIVVVAALLTWAFTVGSLADVAAVLGVLALMGVTPGSQEAKPAILTAKPTASSESVVISLGDSYSSGEGASRYLDETNVARNQCRRASTAWPVLVAQSLGADRLVFRACSGARARNLVGKVPDDEQYDSEGIQVARAKEQLRAVDKKLTPALVVLSIGGNDAGFRQIGSSCLSLHSCDDPKLTKDFYENLKKLEGVLRATYVAIVKAFPGAPIAVMPYPDAFAKDDGCVQAPVEPGDIRFVRTFTDKLDATIQKVADESAVYYVAPMRSALKDSKLALCDDSGTPGLNFLDLRGVGGAATDRFNPGNWIHNSLHPNERGHAALAAAFTGWLSSQTRIDSTGKQLVGLRALEPPKPDQSDLPTPTNASLCFEPDDGTCGPKADAWALAQLGPGLSVPLVLLVLVAGGTWALAVASSAERFRRRPGGRA